jgi:hypothetical protein
VAAPGNRVHRHGVEYLVRDHHATDALGQSFEPLHAAAKPRALARCKRGAYFDNGVVKVPLRKQRLGESAAAGPDFENRIGEFLQLAGERAAEE